MADPAVGAKAQITGIPEVVWGTTPATPQTRIIPFLSESVNANIGIIENMALRGDRRRAKPAQGNVKPSGDIRVIWSATAHAWLVYTALGGSVVTVGAVAPYVHTIQESSSPSLKSFTYEKGFTDNSDYIVNTGARINTWTHEMNPEDNVNGSISIIAKDETSAVTPLDATPTDIPWEPLNSYDGSATQSAAPVANITSLSLTFTNNAQGISVLFQQNFGAVIAATLRISGTFSLFFEDLTQYTKFRNFTETDLIIRMEDTQGFYIQYDMKSLVYGGSTPQVTGEGPIFFSGEFTGFINAAAGKQLEVVIANDIASIIV